LADLGIGLGTSPETRKGTFKGSLGEVVGGWGSLGELGVPTIQSEEIWKRGEVAGRNRECTWAHGVNSREICKEK